MGCQWLIFRVGQLVIWEAVLDVPTDGDSIDEPFWEWKKMSAQCHESGRYSQLVSSTSPRSKEYNADALVYLQTCRVDAPASAGQCFLTTRCGAHHAFQSQRASDNDEQLSLSDDDNSEDDILPVHGASQPAQEPQKAALKDKGKVKAKSTPYAHESASHSVIELQTQDGQDHKIDETDAYLKDDLRHRIFIEFEMFLVNILHLPTNWRVSLKKTKGSETYFWLACGYVMWSEQGTKKKGSYIILMWTYAIMSIDVLQGWLTSKVPEGDLIRFDHIDPYVVRGSMEMVKPDIVGMLRMLFSTPGGIAAQEFINTIGYKSNTSIDEPNPNGDKSKESKSKRKHANYIPEWPHVLEVKEMKGTDDTIDEGYDAIRLKTKGKIFFAEANVFYGKDLLTTRPQKNRTYLKDKANIVDLSCPKPAPEAETSEGESAKQSQETSNLRRKCPDYQKQYRRRVKWAVDGRKCSMKKDSHWERTELRKLGFSHGILYHIIEDPYITNFNRFNTISKTLFSVLWMTLQKDDKDIKVKLGTTVYRQRGMKLVVKISWLSASCKLEMTLLDIAITKANKMADPPILRGLTWVAQKTSWMRRFWVELAFYGVTFSTACRYTTCPWRVHLSLPSNGYSIFAWNFVLEVVMKGLENHEQSIEQWLGFLSLNSSVFLKFLVWIVAIDFRYEYTQDRLFALGRCFKLASKAAQKTP
ncbi:hypothetical protein ARMSODRAFT_982044 [Armillaria solidipes]|uniref:Fungal-type protein kinase domain-containing protein n=1 Tax=Armillaria solidipes TaxID=1076256 RepID=A0A2H3BCN6_9AGAR|nr:hypothetical protein ARMSODRAFT_982044 [Armillaria solidipes]